MIEYLVAQGHQVFVMSWRNPDARHRDWDLDSYGSAVTAALGAVRSICQVPRASVCALCSGGIAAAMVAAHLSVAGRLGELATLCLGVTVLDQAQAGASSAVIDRRPPELAMASSRRPGPPPKPASQSPRPPRAAARAGRCRAGAGGRRGPRAGGRERGGGWRPPPAAGGARPARGPGGPRAAACADGTLRPTYSSSSN